jgi:dolichol-phosphate mannosyltransferase
VRAMRAVNAGVTVGPGRRTRPRLAVVMPAYNEDGLPEFLDELESALTPVVDDLRFVVVDDCSTVPADHVLQRISAARRMRLTVARNPTNLGHGPSALRAYRYGLESGADLILHVDGDGQFEGADVAELVTRVWQAPDVDGAVGLRTVRSDPWFRKVLTRCARAVVAGAVGPVRDANTPLRVYRPAALRTLLTRVTSTAIVPHLQFSVLERRTRMVILEQAVTHRVRRGEDAVGTTWQRRRGPRQLPSRRLLAFSWSAASELRACVRGSQRCDVAVSSSPGLPPVAAVAANP